MRAKWSLVTYDICDAKRLRRVHRLLTKRGVAVQQSVFLFHGSGGALRELLQRIDDIVDAESDDVRSYPVAHPARFWSSAQIVRSLPELSSSKSAGRSWPERVVAWFGRRGAA